MSAKSAPTSHLTPYITIAASDPFREIQTVIAAAKGEKGKVDGIHSGLGLADYAALTLLDSDPKPTATAAVNCEKLKDDEIACKLEEHCCKSDGSMKAIDWLAIWPVVKPLVFELLQRWLFS